MVLPGKVGNLFLNPREEICLASSLIVRRASLTLYPNVEFSSTHPNSKSLRKLEEVTLDDQLSLVRPQGG